MTATRTRARRAEGRDRHLERRHEIRRRQGARRLRWVLGLTVVAFAALSMIGLVNSQALAVDGVTVDGVERSLAEQVYGVSGVKPGQPLIDVDATEVSLTVEELPWVRTATVDRAWSGTVTITVEPRRALLALAAADGSGFVGVDRDGVQVARLAAEDVVETVPASTDAADAGRVTVVHGLPVLIEPGAVVPPETALAINFVVSAPDDVRSLVGRLEIEKSSLIVHLQSGAVVDLGDSRQLGAKYQALETVLSQVDLACLATVDVSAPAAPSVTRSCRPDERGGQDG